MPSAIPPALSSATPFTRAAAIRSGMTDEQLYGPRFQRVFFGVYVAAEVELTPLVRARAALAASAPGSYASHFTAAEIWDVCPPQQTLTHVTVSPDAVKVVRRGIRSHERGSVADVVHRRGVALSSPTQTFLELAGHVGLVDLVVVGDRLVRKGMATPEVLVRLADGWSGPGARLARRAARLVREGVDSPMETRVRMLIVLAGLPEPKVDLILRDAQGDWRFRLDMSYPGVKLIVEYDGRQHNDDLGQWDRDLERREWFDRWGWRLLVIRADGVYKQPEQTLQRIATALRERGASGVPRRFRTEWRQHFPGQPLRDSAS